MPSSKQTLLKNLKKAVKDRQEADTGQLFTLRYLQQWSAALDYEHDELDVLWLKQFTDRFHLLFAERKLQERELIGRLFVDCGLTQSRPDDVEMLLFVLAQGIYPSASGAKQKWHPGLYAEFSRAIDLITASAPKKKNRVLNPTEIAKLIKNAPRGAKFTKKNRGWDQSLSVRSLRSRITETQDLELGLNPESRIWDYFHTVRHDPAAGPARAENIPIQQPFPKGSKEAAQAATLESKIFDDAARFFDYFGIYSSERQKTWIRICARRIARQSIRRTQKV